MPTTPGAGLVKRRRAEEPAWRFAARKHRDGILPVDRNGGPEIVGRGDGPGADGRGDWIRTSDFLLPNRFFGVSGCYKMKHAGTPFPACKQGFTRSLAVSFRPL